MYVGSCSFVTTMYTTRKNDLNSDFVTFIGSADVNYLPANSNYAFLAAFTFESCFGVMKLSLIVMLKLTTKTTKSFPFKNNLSLTLQTIGF